MAEYIVNNPVSIKVINTDGKILRSPQKIRERVVRCRDCGFARRDGDDICCARSLRLDERGVSRLSLVRLNGFCAWASERDQNE